jgi:hypothetical protein
METMLLRPIRPTHWFLVRDASARYRPTKLWRAAGLIQAGPGTPPQ